MFILSLINNLIFVKSLQPSVVIEDLRLVLLVASHPPEEETFAFDPHCTLLEIFESWVIPYIYHPQ